MPNALIHHAKSGPSFVWQRCKEALLGADETAGSKIPCPWCEGAKILYDDKSGLLVHCDCCARTGFVVDNRDRGTPFG